MNFLGLNSPEIFIISVIILTFLGPKRIEKGWLSFQRFLKYLLSNEDDSSKDKLNEDSQFNFKSEKPEAVEVKEESIEAKSKEPEAVEVKEESIEAKSDEPEVVEVKADSIEEKSDQPEAVEVKKVIDPNLEEKKPKQKKSKRK